MLTPAIMRMAVEAADPLASDALVSQGWISRPGYARPGAACRPCAAVAGSLRQAEAAWVPGGSGWRRAVQGGWRFSARGWSRRH